MGKSFRIVESSEASSIVRCIKDSYAVHPNPRRVAHSAAIADCCAVLSPGRARLITRIRGPPFAATAARSESTNNLQYSQSNELTRINNGFGGEPTVDLARNAGQALRTTDARSDAVRHSNSRFRARPLGCNKTATVAAERSNPASRATLSMPVNCHLDGNCSQTAKMPTKRDSNAKNDRCAVRTRKNDRAHHAAIGYLPDQVTFSLAPPCYSSSTHAFAVCNKFCSTGTNGKAGSWTRDACLPVLANPPSPACSG